MDDIIVHNRKAHYRYSRYIEEFEAGIVLEGWEAKSIQQKRIGISEAYVIIKDNEVFLIGSQITPLATVPDYVKPDPFRTRKLLLNRKEINSLIGSVNRIRTTIVPITVYRSKGKFKIKIVLARGNTEYDKRENDKARDIDLALRKAVKTNQKEIE